MILGNPSSRRDSFFALPFLFLLLLTCAHTDAQGIIGVTRDNVTSQPVANARIYIIAPNDTIELVTDSVGLFTLTTAMVARVTVEAIALGYAVAGENILLDGYTTHRIALSLSPVSYELESVSVTGSLSTPPYAERITKDDLLRVAGNFDDPVRIAQSKPGIVLLNDQANYISVRGQSPLFNSWYLEGLEIVNPSHTNNAGTINDQPTGYGGGINMLSVQALGNTDVYTGINPIRLSRTAGGVIDMHLHETAKPEFRLKAGLLGFEAGGGAKVGNGFIDVNLRYSFTGMLADFGVDFDGEKIGFYDGVLSYYQQGSNYKFKLFGWAGRSTNDFQHAENIAEREQFKDFFDIQYANNIFGAGTTLDVSLGKKTSLKLGGAYSTLMASHARQGFDQYAFTEEANDYEQEIIYAMSNVAFIPVHWLQGSIGIDFTDNNLSYRTTVYQPLYKELYYRPHADVVIHFSHRARLEVGGEMKNFTNEGVASTKEFGYRVLGNYQTGDASSVFAGFRHSPGQAVQYPFESEEESFYMLLIEKAEMGWQYLSAKTGFSLKAYHQSISNMTYYTLEQGTLHIADYTEAPAVDINFNVSPQHGDARYYGAEFAIRHSTDNNWSFDANQSLLKSQRKVGNAEYEDSRFDNTFITHVSVAKEIIRERNGRNRIWNFSLRGIVQGGFSEPTIDLITSQELLSTVYADPYALENKLPVYKRIDLGIYRTITTSRFRWRYALDIQNAFGFTNEAYHYFDPFLNRVETKEHLGIIPVLSLQVSW